MPITNVDLNDVATLKTWLAGENENNGAVVIELQLLDKPSLVVQMSPQRAHDLSDSLIQLWRKVSEAKARLN